MDEMDEEEERKNKLKKNENKKEKEKEKGKGEKKIIDTYLNSCASLRAVIHTEWQHQETGRRRSQDTQDAS